MLNAWPAPHFSKVDQHVETVASETAQSWSTCWLWNQHVVQQLINFVRVCSNIRKLLINLSAMLNFQHWFLQKTELSELPELINSCSTCWFLKQMLIISCSTCWFFVRKLFNCWSTCCFLADLQHVDQLLINYSSKCGRAGQCWATVDQYVWSQQIFNMLVNCWATCCSGLPEEMCGVFGPDLALLRWRHPRLVYLRGTLMNQFCSSSMFWRPGVWDIMVCSAKSADGKFSLVWLITSPRINRRVACQLRAKFETIFGHVNGTPISNLSLMNQFCSSSMLWSPGVGRVRHQGL